MPFGLSNAPATFQRLMNELFQQSLHQTNLIFLDDVLTYSKTAEDHLKHLEEVFVTLRNANLKLKPKMCQLFQRQVVYLGHVIGVDGTSPDPEKTSKVKEWPVPKTVRDVRSFIGFVTTIEDSSRTLQASPNRCMIWLRRVHYLSGPQLSKHLLAGWD